MTPDDFHAYKSNLPPGCSDAQVSERFDGGDDVEWGEEESQFMLRVDVGGGKYTVIQDDTGRLTALRYGEPWRDCCGDGLILALAYELEEARIQLAAKISTETQSTKLN